MGVRGRKRAAPVNIDDNTQKNSEYEQLREKRIKENLERMQKLGIFEISLKLKPVRTPIARKTPQRLSPLQPPGPTRRSSRLQNATPISYSEVHVSKNDNSLDGEHHLLREEGSKPEIYTEEHEKLLGTTDLSWTFFVDGYGNDGKRIYDPFKGKTCHQCRQKTLGHRTHCSNCQMVQGQFCGDCLYMRYGEHVLEANKNPNWICPVCRGICNCSLCRQAKGWAPTGALYRKIAGLGYKSVAHYLIQTHRATVSTENNLTPFSAKRSLPFSDMEGTTKDEGLCEMKPVAYDANEPNLAPERSTESLLKSIAEPLLLPKHDRENSVTILVLSSDNVGYFSADNKSGNENAVLVGSSLTSQTEVKPVEYDGNDPNLALESSSEPLLKSIVEPLLLLKHDSDNSGKNLLLSCDNAGNFSADNKSGNENAVLVGNSLTSQTEVKPVEYDGNEPDLAPENSTETLLKSIVEPLLLLKHDSDNSGTNLVLSSDNVGNFSADNKSGNENAVLVGNLLTSQTEVKPVEYDGNEPKLAPESSTEPLLKSIVEPLLLLKHDSENSGKNLVLSCDNAGNFSADNKSGKENAVLVGSALTSSAPPVLTELNDVYKGESQLGYEFDIGQIQSKEQKEDGSCVLVNKNCDVVAPEASSKSKKKPCWAAAPVVDTIAGRLRQRRGRSNVEA
ncbi:uncharacterized protein LOC129874198 [Solanum dulcamara]|uniref:uncharacterized protein LOC129874198 n=1 Tax=Solanum dulcamara TaxID=45834 RepID=UPI00248532FE|nr:uncharacterized protein LOC129874198 [Solanum dulcamara]